MLSIKVPPLPDWADAYHVSDGTVSFRIKREDINEDGTVDLVVLTPSRKVTEIEQAELLRTAGRRE